MLRTLLLAVALAVCSCDPLKDAILGKGIDDLKTIALKAGLDFEDGDSLETLQKLVYEFAQNEKPAHMPRYHWDGTEMPKKEADEPAKPKPKQQAEQPKAPNLDAVSKMMFSTLDKDKDGSLSREELKSMIDQVNAQATAAGETSPSDFFATLDRNSDGKVDRAEADETFKQLAKGGSAGQDSAPKAAATPPSDEDMSAPLFKAMDKDSDGNLSREEMSTLIEKGNAANKAQGLPEVDFFETLDWDKDGVVSLAESKEWFAAMAKELGGAAGKKDEL